MTKSSHSTSESRIRHTLRTAGKRRTIIPAPPQPARQPTLFADLVPRPVIVPRPEHCISRKDIDREALKVLYRLKDHGYIAYLVGGSVRDLLLDRRPKDFDVGTDARPEELRRLFRHSRIIGRRFRLVHVYFKGGKVIEVSTFRRPAEEEEEQGAEEVHQAENVYGTPEQDAFRRDLTINGLFYNIADFSVIDYVGGMEDLRQGVIRAIGDPERRFLRDPVRMMRAVRHAARAEFTIEPVTWRAIERHNAKIRLCAVPRVRDEWLKDLKSGCSRRWAELILANGLLTAIFPGYTAALADPKGDTVRTLLLGLLGHLDRLLHEGQEVRDAFALALFLYPRLHVTPEWKALRSDRLRWPTQEVRSMIEESLAPYDFRKSVRDTMAQVLASQWPIRTCLAGGSWPKRIWSKSTFPEAVLLYDLVQEILGLPTIGPEPHLQAAHRTPPPIRKRRRRPRGRRTS